MSEFALLGALSKLDSRWSSLERWLWVCTAAVVVGLLFEVAIFLWERTEEVKEFRRGTIHSPDRPSKLKFVLELTGTALVTLGVLGELIVGFKASKVETDMRNDTAQLVALVDQKAADARLAAAGANVLAQSANLQAATLEKEAVSLGKQAETERLARVRLEKSIQPRDLNAEQQTSVINSLREYSGRYILIWTYPSDAEGDRLAAVLRATLKRAGIDADIAPGFLKTTELPFQGIRIEGTDKKFSSGLEKALQPYLEIAPPKSKSQPGVIPAGGVEFGVYIPPGHAQTAADIYIGVKPIPNVRP